MKSCEGCYCNKYMQAKKGCLYMFQDQYKKINKECPCKECIVRLMCRDRFNVCRSFHDFLMSNQVRITHYGDKFNTEQVFSDAE